MLFNRLCEKIKQVHDNYIYFYNFVFRKEQNIYLIIKVYSKPLTEKPEQIGFLSLYENRIKSCQTVVIRKNTLNTIGCFCKCRFALAMN